MPDVEGFERKYESRAKLVERKSNKDYNGAWCKDLNIDFDERYGVGEDDESINENENSSVDVGDVDSESD